jgi:hypothetical protein
VLGEMRLDVAPVLRLLSLFAFAFQEDICGGAEKCRYFGELDAISDSFCCFKCKMGKIWTYLI